MRFLYLLQGLSDKMRAATVLSLVLPLICLSYAQHAEVGDLDPRDGMNEEEFRVMSKTFFLVEILLIRPLRKKPDLHSNRID